MQSVANVKDNCMKNVVTALEEVTAVAFSM